MHVCTIQYDSGPRIQYKKYSRASIITILVRRTHRRRDAVMKSSETTACVAKSENIEQKEKDNAHLRKSIARQQEKLANLVKDIAASRRMQVGCIQNALACVFLYPILESACWLAFAISLS